jgi:hypothetical protein
MKATLFPRAEMNPKLHLWAVMVFRKRRAI